MGGRDERQRWGSKPHSWVKYHGKRGHNQRFSSILCVDEALRFLPHYGLQTYGALFFVRLRRDLQHVRKRKDITMDIGIIGAGSVAQAFARHALQVGHTMKISNSRGPSTLRDTVHTLGAGVTAVTTEGWCFKRGYRWK